MPLSPPPMICPAPVSPAAQTGWLPPSWVRGTGGSGAAAALCTMAVPCQLCSFTAAIGATQCTDSCAANHCTTSCAKH